MRCFRVFLSLYLASIPWLEYVALMGCMYTPLWAAGDSGRLFMCIKGVSNLPRLEINCYVYRLSHTAKLSPASFPSAFSPIPLGTIFNEKSTCLTP